MKRNSAILFGFAAAGGGLLIWSAFFGGLGGESGGRADRIPCINPVLPILEQEHIHPHLRIVVNGNDVAIPANIGIAFLGCERVLHSHDHTGTLHIEPNFHQEFTLGDFFDLWGKPFSRDGVLGYAADVEHEIILTVNSERSEAYRDLILRDKQDIVIEYRKR